VDKDQRASLLAACTAAALSALVGVIAGVSFLVLMLRALGGGLLIGAATYGGIFLLKRTMPGLFESQEASVQDQVIEPLSAPEMGSNVDIVLPGELPAAENEMGAESLAPTPGTPESAQARFDRLPESGRSEDTADADAEEPSLLEAEDPSFAGEAAIPSGTAGGGGKQAAPGLDELDVLPDLDGFSDSFTASEFASGGRSEGRAASPAQASGVSVPRTAQGGPDSVALAQAVRTILKRDQKG
jgi:hypothetical protein